MVSIDHIYHRADQISRRTRQVLACALLTTIATGMTMNAKGQTFAEWFQQKKTQKKYLLEQIAALGAYADYLHKGYTVAKKGTGTISGYLGEEWLKHSEFYTRKQKISAVLRDNPRVTEILRWQQDILQQVKRLNVANAYSKQELEYLNKVSQSVLQDCVYQSELLEKVGSNDQLTMSDEERLQLINKIHEDMSGNLRFTTSFVNQALLYAARKKRALGSN